MSGLEQEFPGKVTAANVDATSEESMRAVKQLGFENHGLVIRDSAGTTLWKQPDHEVELAAVRQALEDLLEEQ